MKLNRKGFTLIELLAVIVLLITISAIAIPSITASIERSKAKQAEAKLNVIIDTVKLYYSDHKVKMQDFINGRCYIDLNNANTKETLGLTDKDLENPQGGTFNKKISFMNDEYYYGDVSGINSCW